ncbi:MCE family protein [bacterium]|nr:MCE family protein [bacterium]
METERRVGLFVILAIGIFFYLSFHIGGIRFDKTSFATYKVYFEDTGGLEARSPVKIAGVQVGWVESIELLDGGKAEIELRVHKQHRLAKNSYARITQEGLLGVKNVDIDPGDPVTGYLPQGSIIAMPGKAPTSVSDLLDQFKSISDNINDVTCSLKNVFVTQEGESNMKDTLKNVHKASDDISDFSGRLKRTGEVNEEPIRETVVNIKEASDSAKSTIESVGGAADKAKDAFTGADEVIDKVNRGEGLLGKIINEDDLYGDIKKTVRGIKDYVGAAKRMAIHLDMHTERLFGIGKSRGCMDVRISPHSDYFYNLQIISDSDGRFERNTFHYRRRDAAGNLIDPNTQFIDHVDATTADSQSMDRRSASQFAAELEEVIQRKDKFLIGFQFGKKFRQFTFRVGLFDNTVGGAVDYELPFKSDKFSWTTSFEAFDFTGYNKLNDTKAHIRWINKITIERHLYSVFGFDDLVSKEESTPFIGFGICFDDEDIKYLLSSLSGSKIMG